MIEEEAFYGDTSLEEVVLPEGIERIESRAFANCSMLALKVIFSSNSLWYLLG